VVSQKRKNIASGLMLILIGLAFLAFQIFPGLNVWVGDRFTWPVGIMLVAAGLLAIGVLTGTADMLIPASIVAGIGGILYLQNERILTWESWAYLWTLIPGFVGIGVLLSGIIQWKRSHIIDGLQTMLVSAVLFFIFGSWLGDMFGFFPFQDLLPFLLIALGVVLFIRALFDRGRTRPHRSVE
jgi:hypothetical protein